MISFHGRVFRLISSTCPTPKRTQKNCLHSKIRGIRALIFRYFGGPSRRMLLLGTRMARQTEGSSKPWFLKSPLSWALEPRCRILLFMRSLGHLITAPAKAHIQGPCPDGLPGVCYVVGDRRTEGLVVWCVFRVLTSVDGRLCLPGVGGVGVVGGNSILDISCVSGSSITSTFAIMLQPD